MLYINDQLPHVQLAKKQHAKLITCYIRRRLEGKSPATICSDSACKICNSGTQKAKISDRLLAKLRTFDWVKLIDATPDVLFRLSNQFNGLYNRNTVSNADKKALERIFNYTWFENKRNKLYNAYELCNNLKVETCVYCNRSYTSTVINKKGEKIIRPTLDHWFPQTDYPLLSLSFYNLIPACASCNSSVKHDSMFSLVSHVHPYVDKAITSDYRLVSIYDNSLNSFKITIDTSDSRIRSTLEAMEIEQIYQHHQSELADLDLIKRKYNKSYLTSLGNLLNAKLSEKEVYRIMFGVEYEDEDFYKRPLSKLKKDILVPKIV